MEKVLMNSVGQFFKAQPKVVPSLDPTFQPGSLSTREFKRCLRASAASPVPVNVALEQADGSTFHFHTEMFPENSEHAGYNFAHLERWIKFLLWSRGACRIYFKGPESLAKRLQDHFHDQPTGQFDADLMGRRVYERPFEVVRISSEALPPAREATRPLGRHLEGYRIGFDLGASDRKAAAVVNGEVVFSEEVPWDPVKQTDPQWHYDQLMAMLKSAASHMPRVDAIGGSAAGVYVNNRVQVASLFRGVPANLFDSRVKTIFWELKKAWNNVPFEVVNDGEVTALAGAMSLNANSVLGVALGSSQAAGYVTGEGNITSWLNELAFAPVDYRHDAPVDEWSGDYGCGVQYFSQQCVGRLLKPAGIEVDPQMPLPEKLKHVQKLMESDDSRAAAIYHTIGVYLGYGVAHYADFYDIRNVLLLGRVTTGPGGSIILEQAQTVLKTEFPDLANRIAFHTPSERDKRHGQAIAAASLPVL
ncbi:MAG TPA: ROK family protein [Verrucomicrobiota bacterium]|nr:ROK family protein [Verrucomicrobiota bacterium]